MSGPAPERQAPPARLFAVLVALGALATVWAVVLWGELVRARAGGTPFCAFGQDDCADLWNAGFAKAVQAATGVPVAGWGVVWGLVALGVPLVSLLGAAEGRRRSAAESATALAAAVGVGGVVVLLGASVAAGTFCSSCAVTYVVTLAYGVVAFLAWRRGMDGPSSSGATVASGAVLAAWLLVLVPGLRTPGDVAAQGERALREVAESAGSGRPGGQGGRAGSAASANADAASSIAQMIANLPPEARQALADSLYLYRNAPALPPEEPRALHGPADAPVRITEFTDPLCPHCATLHGTLKYLRDVLPAGSFSVDSRQFPLDGNCNPHLEVRGPESVRCVASRARVCLEESDFADTFAEVLFQRQDALTPAAVRDAASPFVAASDLEACLASGETAAKLRADADYAWKYRPDGTPLVLVNGRQGTSFGPFLYAIVLTGGDPDHPAFEGLPAPNPNAHLH